jgi:hypothetical protein
MIYRNWRQPKGKIHDSKNKIRKNKRYIRHKDEMKAAMTGEDEFKKKKKRLSLDWFFRPEGD